MQKKSFLRIQCPRCSQAHMIYGKSSSEVKCSKCNYLLTKSTGGKAKIRAKITEVLCL